MDRYPWPKICIHDNGGEFTGWEFQNLLRATSIKDVPTTSRNPQENAICERMHQKVVNLLPVLLYTNPPSTVANAADLIYQAISTEIHSMRVNVTTTLKGSPGSLVSGRDMFLAMPLISDWKMIEQHRQTLFNEILRRMNQILRIFDYIKGQRVLKKKHRPDKLGELTKGPYQITRVHTNVTISTDLCPNITERINIRRVISYRKPTRSYGSSIMEGKSLVATALGRIPTHGGINIERTQSRIL